MIEDRNYSEEEVAEDLLDLIKEFEAEIKKLKEREKTLLKLLQTSLGDSPAAQIDEYVRVKIDLDSYVLVNLRCRTVAKASLEQLKQGFLTFLELLYLRLELLYEVKQVFCDLLFRIISIFYHSLTY